MTDKRTPGKKDGIQGSPSQSPNDKAAERQIHPQNAHQGNLVIDDIDDGHISEEFPERIDPEGLALQTDRDLQGSGNAGKDDAGDSADSVGKRSFGAHAKSAQSKYIQKSTRMRNILVVVIILLVVLLGVIAFFGIQIYNTARITAEQQTLSVDIDSTSTEQDASDATPSISPSTAVPDLVSLLGLTQDEAVAALAHGAQVTRSTEVNEEGNPIKWDVQIALTDEPADSRSGTPTVYLGINGDLSIIRVGYSVATSSLGYGSLSFTDAIQNEHIIEKTLEAAGLTVSVGSAVLPADKTEYSTYASDGTTLIKEFYSFTGVGQARGVEHFWEGSLAYDYAMANATGNLNDTIRTIYIYIS